MTWNWRKRPGRLAPVVTGDIDAIVEDGQYTREELERASALLTAGFPPDFEIVVEWQKTASGVLVSAEAEGCQMEQSFHGPRTNLHVDYGSFLLPPKYKAFGLGNHMVRASLTLYDELKVRTVNIDTYRDGNLKWALLRAYPRDPQGEATLLLREILRLRRARKLTALDAAVLWQIVDDSVRDEPEHLMYNVGCYVDDDERCIGADVLKAFSWGAIWRLWDQEQRGFIAQALSRRRPNK